MKSKTRTQLATLDRANALFAAHQQTIYRTTDHMFAVLMAVQWIGGIAAALWISPRTWIGTTSQTHLHVWTAIFLGGAINIFPIALAIKNPGAATTRYVIATAQMMMSALLIHLTGGRIETHFHVFGSLAFLAFYRDWRVLLPATIVVAADHFLRGVFWPQSVYGVLAASQWRWLEHAGWVLFEDAFLFVAIKRSVAEMWENARSRAELNESEERYRAVVEQTAEGMVLADVVTKRVIECNSAFANLLGYTLEEALSLTAYDFVVDEREAIDRRSGSPLDRRLPITGECRFRHKNGGVLDVEINSTVITYGGNDVFCTIVRDISERKRAEEALRESELKFRSVTQSANDAIVSADSKGIIVSWNKGAERAFGYTEKEILGKPLTQLMPEEYRAAHIKGMERFNSTGEARVFGKTLEMKGLRKDGTVFPFELSLASWRATQGTFFTGIFRDITERKQAEEALRKAHDELELKVQERTVELAQLNEALKADNVERKRAEEALKESQQWLKAIFDSSRDGIIVEENERIVYVNQSYAHLFGYEPEELIGQPVALVSEQEPTERMLEYSRRRMRGEEAPSLYEFRGTRRDGTTVDLEASVSTAKIGEKTYIIALCRDITERKEAQAALQETNLASSNAMPGISILNPEGRYERVNEAYAEMVGYQPEEMIGMDWTPTVADDDRVHAIAAYERMLTEGKAEFEAQGVRKNGSLFYKHVLMVKRTDTDGNFLGHHCFMRDITERRRMEQEREVIFAVSQGVITTQDLDELLKLVHQSISKVLYAENCFVALYDEATDLMKFQFWVDKFDPCPAPRPVGTGFSSYVLRTGKPILVDRALTEEMVRRGEVQQSGTMSASWIGVPLKTATRTIGVLVVQHYEDEDAYSQNDVDFLSSVAGQIALAIERKRAEEELSNQREFFRQVIDLNPSFIFAKDREGRFTLVNQALADAYGTTVAELLGKSDADFNRNKEEVEWFRRDDLEVIDGGKEKFIPEEDITDAAGNLRCLQTIKRPIIAADGSAKQLLGVATDITQRKKAEEALRESEAMLRQAQKMESIGTLAGGIAHDFNNLMTAVTGYSELTLRRLGPDDPLRPKIEEIKKAGERATALTRQLLAFSRKQILQPVVLDLNTIVTGIGKMLPRLIGEDIDLRFELSASLGQVKADPGQMEQVLMNLAVNARDAMPSGGRLAIKTENVEFAGRFVKQRMVVEPGNYVVLSVTDNGVGMDAETQSHLFEPFFTTKEIGKGTGLGLATVYGIVKQTGGSIWVYSEPGKGSAFRIYLPKVNEPMATENVDQNMQPRPTGHETILLVEDEETVRDLAKEILEEYGYRLLTASNGDEGLRAYREHSDKIDLVITDVVMPEMNGRELAERIRAIRPETRVLYMSGFTDDAVVRHGVQADDICFIQKPFSPEALAIKARELLDHNGSNGEESTKLEPQLSNSLEKSTYGYHPLNR